jgi:hypothetical protein
VFDSYSTLRENLNDRRSISIIVVFLKGICLTDVLLLSFRQLAASLSPRGSGFSPRPVSVSFVLKNVAVGQTFLRVAYTGFPVSVVAQMFDTHSFIYHPRYRIFAIDSVVK